MEFWRFIGPDTDLGSTLQGSYNPYLVALSVLVATLAALAALAVVDRILMLRSRGQGYQRTWLLVGSVVMGSGVWAMHFTAMLAYRLPVGMSFDVVLTIVSMIPAMLGSGCALHFMSRRSIDGPSLQLGGLMLALGIGTMHYTGMEAMRIDADMRYDLALFVASIVVAHLLATAALYVRFLVPMVVARPVMIRLLSALVMGSAVAGMHYTAMLAARFYPGTPHAMHGMMMPPVVLAGVLAAVVSMITALTLVGTIIDRRFMEAIDLVADAGTRYQTMLDATDDGVLVLDSEGRIETFNPAAERIFGADLQQKVGTHMSVLTMMHDGDESAVRSGGAVLTADGLPQPGHNLTGRRGDGTPFPMSLAIGKMTLQGRDLYTCMVRDLAERRELEQMLTDARNLEANIEVVTGLAHEMQTPTERIVESVRAIDERFRKLLVPIRRLADVTRLPSGSNPLDALARLDEVVKQVDLERLVYEIPLAIERCCDSVQEVQSDLAAMQRFFDPVTSSTAVDVNEAIQSAVRLTASKWRTVATIDIDLDPEMPPVRCIPARLNQVILNMLLNATRAITRATGGGEKMSGRITVTTRKRDGWAVIRITDNGAGIPPSIKDEIVDCFVTTKAAGVGVGLGLRMARHVIVETHGGQLMVTSEVGRGSCFTIKLPLEQPERAAGLSQAGTVPEPAAAPRLR